MTEQVNSSNRGVVRALAYRPADGDPMIEVDSGHVLPGRGFDTENRKAGQREITLLSAEAWTDTCSELDTVLPWHTRRANLLIEGIDLVKTIGQTISIGTVRIRVHMESKPCGLMEQQHAGLRAALGINGRGGVAGEVLEEGTIATGDAVTCT